MEVGGQAADQIVRTEIQLTEEAIKLLASGSKNLAAFLLALAKDNKKVMGKTNMGQAAARYPRTEVFSNRGKGLDEIYPVCQGIWYPILRRQEKEPRGRPYHTGFQ